MGDFEFKHSLLHNVIQITPKMNVGQRDLFVKNYEKGVYTDNGIDFTPTEEFMIKEEKSIFRGIHFQKIKPQKRVITVLSGDIYVTVVDLNKKSCQLGQYETFLLQEKEPRLIFVPEWYGLATISIKDNTIISVITCGAYYEKYSTGICYNDDSLNIQWPVNNFHISEKDKRLMTFKEYLCQ